MLYLATTEMSTEQSIFPCFCVFVSALIFECFILIVETLNGLYCIWVALLRVDTDKLGILELL